MSSVVFVLVMFCCVTFNCVTCHHAHLQVSDDALHAVRAHNLGSLVAVGSQQGNITVLELSSGLSYLQPNEKNLVNAVSLESHKPFVEIRKGPMYLGAMLHNC